MPSPVGCSFIVEVEPEAPLSSEHGAELQSRLEHFTRAIQLGMFAPGRLISALQPEPLSAASPSSVQRYVFRATALPVGSFTVLAGMLASFSQSHAPLRAFSTRLLSGEANLLEHLARLPSIDRPLPFLVHQSSWEDDIASDVSIRFEFARPPPEDMREPLCAALASWDALLCGGYPPEGAGLGESAVGATSTRFLHPGLLEHSIEGLHASSSCLVPLVNLALRWSDSWPVRQVEVE